MALIKDAQGRYEGSGYVRLFGDPDIGRLVSRVHSTLISSGTELERIIKSKVELIPNLDEFLKQDIMPDGVFVADKAEIKKCKTLDFAGSEPDFLVFKRRQGQQKCHVVELKDGDSFDTKKASAEHRAMHSFISKNGARTSYRMQAHFCCFNQNDRQAIIKGFKSVLAPEEAMTGREFCELLELDYMEIIKARATQGEENVRYFLTELVKIDSVRKVFEDLDIVFPK